MKPLSVLSFYKNNRRKVLPVSLTVFLSVSLLFILQVLVDSSFYLTYLVFVEPQEHYSSISARTELISPELVETVKGWDSVDEVLPWLFQHTYLSTVIDSTGSKVLTVKRGDMERLMTLFSLRVKSGRLPDAGKNEIALHELVAANKNLKEGGKIGSKVNGGEALSGEYSIVGILEGPSVISFSSLEYWMEEYKIKDPFCYGMILLPKKGYAEKLDSQLADLPYQGLDIRTADSVRKEYESSASGGRLIINIIDLTVIAIVSICTGFLCYVYFNQRRAEFGILNAIGYTRRQIIRKAFIEVGVMSAAGLAAGLLASVPACVLLNAFVLMPRGQLLKLWNPEYIFSTLCIPIFVTVFSVIPVWRMLDKLDPVEIIEGKA